MKLYELEALDKDKNVSNSLKHTIEDMYKGEECSKSSEKTYMMIGINVKKR